MAKKERVVYYIDERSDEFSGITKNTVRVDGSFDYERKNPLWRLGRFFAYRVIMKPFAYLYCRVKFSLKVKNRKILKPYRKQGYFVFANHTLMAGDAFIPNLLDFGRACSVVVHADNISTPGFKNFVLMCGALPLPTEPSGLRNFLASLRSRYEGGQTVVIYPEAHIWPYCDFVRDFSDVSFAYPVRLGAPVFTSTVTYSKKRFGKTPRVTVYVDGPFFPDGELGLRAAQKKLRDEAYLAMRERARLSSYSPIKYTKREEVQSDE